MNILVTGGFGFIGGHLIDYLTRNYPTDKIHVVDNLSSNPIPLDNLLEELGSRPNLSYSLCSIEEFYKREDKTKWDRIYHLASVVGPAGVLQHAGKIVKSIVDDTYYLIDIALKCHAKLVDVSTSEVYGGGQGGFCSENFPKIVPAKTTVRLEYAVAKLAAETALINLNKVSSLNVVIVRPFNIAGPRQSGRGGFVLPRFISQAIANIPLTIFGKGDQIRAFTHVRDMVKGIVAAMEYGKSGEAYNLGNPKNKISINGLADIVIETVKSKSEKIFVDPKEIYGPLFEEASDKYPDATMAMRELSWNPELSVETTVKDAYNYMRQINGELFGMLSGIR
jgi:UDP-glucose 4-epimerase